MSEGCGWEERVSARSLGELGPAGDLEVEAHMAGCAPCRELAAGLGGLDARLAGAGAPALGKAARDRVGSGLMAALAAEAPDPAPEVMTMAEVARWVRVELADVETELPGLPTFEFAGKLRIRRTRLLEWIEARERRGRGAGIMRRTS